MNNRVQYDHVRQGEHLCIKEQPHYNEHACMMIGVKPGERLPADGKEERIDNFNVL